MLVQTPLSHTSPASHSSTSAGHGGGAVRGPGWRQCRRPLLPFPTPALGLEIRAEASRAQEKPGTLTPLPSGTRCPGAQARCYQGPWPCLVPKSVGLALLRSSSPNKRHLPAAPLPIPPRPSSHFCSYPSSTCHGSLSPQVSDASCVSVLLTGSSGTWLPPGTCFSTALSGRR